MPWPVYSERVLHHQGQGFWQFVVPAETRFILTNIDAVNTAATTARIGVYIGDLALYLAPVQALTGSVHVATRQVAYQGELVRIYVEVAGIHTTVSGYLMTDTSGRTGPPVAVTRLPRADWPYVPPAPATPRAA